MRGYKLMLAAVCLCLLTACGQEEGPDPTSVQVGDTVTIDTIDLTVESITFHKCLNNTVFVGQYLEPLDFADLTVDERVYHLEKNPYYAGEGETVLLVTFTQDNVGSETARALNPETAMEVRYGGETYHFDPKCGGWVDPEKPKYQIFPYNDLTPEADPIHCRAALKVPAEAAEDPENLTLRVVGFEYGIE